MALNSVEILENAILPLDILKAKVSNSKIGIWKDFGEILGIFNKEKGRRKRQWHFAFSEAVSPVFHCAPKCEFNTACCFHLFKSLHHLAFPGCQPY